MEKTLAEKLDAVNQKRAQGDWKPACGGTEEAFTTKMGRRLLYVWQPSTGDHAYLDLDTDLILDYETTQLAIWG